MHRLLTVFVLAGLASACAPDGTAQMEARLRRGEGTSLTAAECTAASSEGKVVVCHATSSKKNPYVAVDVNVQGCINGHAKHEGDFVAATDEECDAPSCAGVGQSCKDNSDCCDGMMCNPSTDPGLCQIPG
jgi:hypothetical protein